MDSKLFVETWFGDPAKWQAKQVLDADELADFAKAYMKENLTEMLTVFCEGLRDYERESGNRLCNDERESVEFVEIFLTSLHQKKI